MWRSAQNGPGAPCDLPRSATHRENHCWPAPGQRDQAKLAAISVTRTSSASDSSITVPKMMFACG